MFASMRDFLNNHVKTSRFFPFMEWLPELRRINVLRADVIAGLTVAMLLIPQSMAYAHLAGLPVFMGLYAAFIPPIIAALFGSSRILSTGPVPVAALLTAVAMQPIAAIGTPEYIHFVLLLTLMAGMIQLILSLMRFGVVVNFISQPVILGFINAVAIIIATMQLGNLLGIYTAPAPHYYQTINQLLHDALINTHWPSVGMAALTFIIILGGRKLWPNLPHTIIAVVITTFLSWLSGYQKLETVTIDQIINLPVQRMLANHARYPQELKTLIAKVEKNKKALQDTIRQVGINAEKTDGVLKSATEANRELDRLVTRNNVEVTKLNRLRFKRLKTPDNHIVFYVSEQMTPIGEVDHHAWRIDTLPEQSTLVLQAGGEVVGNVPKGLPSFQPVLINWDGITKLFTTAFVIALISFTEAITMAKRIATESRQRLNINQELLGQGLAKIIGSYFQSMPVSGGITRTAVNFYAGAKTGFSSIVAGLIVMIVLLWLTPLFYHLPYSTLAALIMIGILGLLDFKKIWSIWKVSRSEALVSLTTFLATLVLAPKIAFAVLLGMVLSLVAYLYETMRPRFTELTRDKEGELVEISKKTDLDRCYLISLVRFNGSLYFANAAYFEEKVLTLISEKQKLRYIILDCVSINNIDASGLETLRNLCKRLEDAGLELWFTRLRHPVQNALKRGGLYDELGEYHFYKNNEAAIDKLGEHLGAKHMNTCPLANKPPER